MVTASLTGVFKMMLIIVGSFFLLRFLGQFMIAKRNMEEERELNERSRKTQKEREEKLKKFGKTTVLGKNTNAKAPHSRISDVEDVDFEEIK